MKSASPLDSNIMINKKHVNVKNTSNNGKVSKLPSKNTSSMNAYKNVTDSNRNKSNIVKRPRNKTGFKW